MAGKKANLPILSLKALMGNDAHEQSRLFEVCASTGIFYLDFESPESSATWESIRQLFAFGEGFFRRPNYEKETVSWDRTGTYFGYKRRGVAVVDSNGTPDSNEFLNISKHDVLHHACNQIRELGLIDKEMAKEANSLVTAIHGALLIILGSLSRTLKLSENDNLTHTHRMDQPSGDHLRFVRYAVDAAEGAGSKVMLIPHTDFGTLTLILTNNPGLQIHDSNNNEWLDVEPLPSLAVVNIGDALVKFTNGLLHACHHRVVISSQVKDKYSLAYFLRPEDNVPLRTISSPAIPQPKYPEEAILSKDWTARRVSASKATYFEREKNWEKLRGTALAWDSTI